MINKNVLRKGFSLFLVILILSNLFCVQSFATDVDIASAVFNNTAAQCENMEAFMPDGGNEINVVKKGGEYGWELNPEEYYVDSYINCDIDDDFMYDLSPEKTVCVEVKYYDENYGGFALCYDSHSGEKHEFVQLTNSCTWKTQKFTLYDAKLKNGVSSYDFQILTNKTNVMGKSPYPVVIASVNVYEEDTISPVKIKATSDRVGNIFFEDDEIVIDVLFNNLTDENYSINVVYDIINNDGESVYQKISNFNISGMITEEVNIPREYIPYGVYEMVVTVSGDGINQTQIVDFSRSRYADEINYAFGTNAHYDDVLEGVYSKKDLDNLSDLIRAVGYGFVRTSVRWWDIEKKKGEYKMPSALTNSLEYANKIGLKPLVIIYQENPLYDEQGDYDLDENPEQLEAFKNYSQFVAKELNGLVDYYCMLNEFNMRDGVYIDSEEQYVNIAKAGYEGLKSGNPDAYISAGELAGPDISYREKLFDLGLLDYCDAFSIHLYNSEGGPEDGWIKNNVVNLRNELAGRDADKHTWITECGWSVREFDGAENYYFFSEQEQMQWLVRNMAIESESGRSDRFFHYCFQDLHYNNFFSRNPYYGIIEEVNYRTPFAAKPAFVAVSAFNDITASKECVGNIATDDNGYAYKFENDKEEIVCVWKSEKQQAGYFRYVTDKPYIEKLDVYGNTLEIIENTSGSYTVKYATEPVYLRGIDSFIDTCQNGNKVNSIWYMQETTPVSVRFRPLPATGSDISLICVTYTNDMVDDIQIRSVTKVGNLIEEEFELENMQCDTIHVFAFDDMQNIIPVAKAKKLGYYSNDEIEILKNTDNYIVKGTLPDSKPREYVYITIYNGNTKKEDIEKEILYQDVTQTDDFGKYYFDIKLNNDTDNFVVNITGERYAIQKEVKL